MSNKITKIVLIINVIFNLILGTIIFQISNLIYRYDRIGAWLEQNDLSNQLCIELQENIILIWIIWGVLTLIAIAMLISEFRKN